MKKNIVLVDKNIPLLAEALAEVAEVTEFEGRKLNRTTLLDCECDMLFVRSTTQVNSALLYGSKVRFVATATSGSEHLDKKYLEENKIKYEDAIGSNAMSVAEYVIFAILKWAFEYDIDLKGKILGIVGFGNVGRRTAHYASLLGLRILVNDPPLYDIGFVFPDYTEYRQLDDLLSECDILTNHVPLNSDEPYSTVSLLNDENLRLLKNNSLVIHVSRGGVVVEKDLINASKRGITVVADVWENEPYVDIQVVRECFLATPHIAGHSFDGKLRGSLMMAKAFERFTGLNPNHAVLAEAMENSNHVDLAKISNIDLFELLKKTKDLEHIHKDFLSTFNEPNSAELFDQMRKNYPIQREIFKELAI